MSYMNLSCLFLKRRNNKKLMHCRYLLSAFLCVFTAGCVFLSGPIKTSYERDEGTEKLIQEKGLSIENITVKKSFDSEAVKENAFYAFNVLLGPYTGKGLKTDVVLKEDSFIKGFDQLNTVSLEIKVKDRNNRIFKIVLITEESENTLSSYSYLYRIIEKGIKETGL